MRIHKNLLILTSILMLFFLVLFLKEKQSNRLEDTQRSVVSATTTQKEFTSKLCDSKMYKKLWNKVALENDKEAFLELLEIYSNTARFDAFGQISLNFAHRNKDIFVLAEYSKIISNFGFNFEKLDKSTQMLSLFYFAKIRELGGDSLIKYELNEVLRSVNELKSSKFYLLEYDKTLINY